MTTDFSFDPARSAVLSMDCQAGIVSIYVKEQEGLLVRTAAVLERARNRGMTIIHVQLGFRPNLPEIGTRNAFFSSLKSSPKHRQLFEGSTGAIHPRIAPAGDDITITKHRVSAFSGTDLEMVLRAKEIDTLFLWGIATSGVVLATFLHAFDADYRLVVLGDCCADLDAELHACLIDKFFPRFARVMTANDFLARTA